MAVVTEEPSVIVSAGQIDDRIRLEHRRPDVSNPKPRDQQPARRAVLLNEGIAEPDFEVV
jgi:hypothetical protein